MIDVVFKTDMKNFICLTGISFRNISPNVHQQKNDQSKLVFRHFEHVSSILNDYCNKDVTKNIISRNFEVHTMKPESAADNKEDSNDRSNKEPVEKSDNHQEASVEVQTVRNGGYHEC